MRREYRYYEQPRKYGLKHYKKGNLEFDYIDPKIKKRKGNIQVVGSMNPQKPISTKNSDLMIIESDGKEHLFEITSSKARILGYLEVEENTYVSVVKSNCRVWMIILILLLGLGLGILWNEMNLESLATGIQDDFFVEEGDDIVYDEPIYQESVQETITIPGYANLIISSDMPSISLINPEGNTVYMKYIILEGKTIIYETKAFEPNKMVKVNMRELLSVGEHCLNFLIQTFDLETQESCNGANQKVNILIKD